MKDYKRYRQNILELSYPLYALLTNTVLQHIGKAYITSILIVLYLVLFEILVE